MKEKNHFTGLLWQYTKGYRRYMLLAFCLLLLELGLSFASPLVLSVTIDSVLDAKPLNAPGYFHWILSLCGGIEYIREHIIVMAVLTVVMAALAGALSFIRPCLTGSAEPFLPACGTSAVFLSLRNPYRRSDPAGHQ